MMTNRYIRRSNDYSESWPIPLVDGEIKGISKTKQYHDRGDNQYSEGKNLQINGPKI